MNTQNVEPHQIPLSELGLVLQSLVQAVVDVPAQVRVRETVWGSSHCFEVQVNPGDTGKALGKQGEVLNAIRTLMSAMSSSHERADQILLVQPFASSDERDRTEPQSLEPLDLEQTRQLLERVLRRVVDMPERLQVTLTPCNHLSVLEIEVSPNNFGQVLGRRGRTIDALRQVLRAMGGKLHRPIHLHLIERFQSPSETIQEASL